MAASFSVRSAREIGWITLAMPVGQMMGDQQGQGRVVGGRTAWPSLTGGQLFDLAGSGADVRIGWAFPGQAERVAAGVSGKSTVDAPGKVREVVARAASLSCIGDSGPRPAAGCASEHVS